MPARLARLPLSLAAIALLAVGVTTSVAPAQAVGGRAVNGQRTQPATPPPGRGTARTMPMVNVNPQGIGIESPDNPLRVDFPIPTAGEPPKLDWGIVPMNSTLHGSVRVINRSEEPLTIAAMRPSCQCTALNDLSGTVIAPGDSAEVALTVESRNVVGVSSNRVRFVFTDGTVTQVDLVFQTTWALFTEPSYIDALTNPYGVIRVQSIDGEPFRILSAADRTPIYADGYVPSSPPRNEYLIVWNVAEYDADTCLNASGERMPMWWTVETDHPGAPMIPLRVRHLPCTQLDVPTGSRRWFLSQHHVALGLVEPGSEHDFELKMKWMPNSVVNDTVERMTDTSDEFDISVTEVVRDGDEITVRGRVRITEVAEGLVYDAATVHGEDRRNSQRLVIIASVDRGDRRAAAD